MSESRSGPNFSEGWVIGLTLLALLVLVGFSLKHFIRGTYIHSAPALAELQQARTIALAMFTYANDNDQKYPTGKSSTEVFQKLLDGKYISDPAIFYTRKSLIPGKVKATSSKLVPANVCWDVTADVVGSFDPDQLPLVYSSGFRMLYVPGGAAVPLSPTTGPKEGLAITFLGNSTKFVPGDRSAGGIARDVIPSSIVFPAGKKYQQLTPDGPLAP